MIGVLATRNNLRVKNATQLGKTENMFFMFTSGTQSKHTQTHIAKNRTKESFGPVHTLPDILNPQLFLSGFKNFPVQT